MPNLSLETVIAADIDDCFDLSLSIDAHTASMDASDERAVAGVTTGTMGPGDTVTWRNEDEETPHTVTFGRIQGPSSVASGDPTAFDGTQSVNSGYIGQNRPLGSDFSVTFAAPGQYRYDCLLHVGEGMSGVVSVIS